MWGVVTPQEAMNIIETQKKEAGITEPKKFGRTGYIFSWQRYL